MRFLADIAVIDRQGRPTALVEVKNKLGTTPDWAAAMRRNLAAHGVLPEAAFFLLATPDRFYFWVNKTSEPAQVLPDFSFEPDAALRPYYEQAGTSPADLAESSLELMLASWLSELGHGDAAKRLPSDALRWLEDSGFLDALRDGTLEQR